MNGVRNSVCNAVTHGVHNDRRRNVQNQNQNQSVLNALGGISIDESIHRQGSRGTGASRMDGRCAAEFGGGSCR